MYRGCLESSPNNRRSDSTLLVSNRPAYFSPCQTASMISSRRTGSPACSASASDQSGSSRRKNAAIRISCRQPVVFQECRIVSRGSRNPLFLMGVFSPFFLLSEYLESSRPYMTTRRDGNFNMRFARSAIFITVTQTLATTPQQRSQRHASDPGADRSPSRQAQ